MPNTPKSPLDQKAGKQPNNILTDLRSAISQASEEEKTQLAKELGLTRATQPPPSRQVRQSTSDVAQMSRMSGGASHDAGFVPAPSDWIVQHGGGMNGGMKKVQTYVNGQPQEIEEFVPDSGEDAFVGNWAVEIYRDRWLNNLPPLPDTSAYDRERVRRGSFEGNPLNTQASMADELAAAATE